MKTTQEWLAQVRASLEKQGYPQASKYRIARAIGISEGTVTLWESGKQMDDSSALKVADYLKIDRNEVLLSAAWSRAKDPTTRQQWESFAKKALGAVVMICMGFGALLTSLNLFDITKITPAALAAAPTDLYIMGIALLVAAWALLTCRDAKNHARAD